MGKKLTILFVVVGLVVTLALIILVPTVYCETRVYISNTNFDEMSQSELKEFKSPFVSKGYHRLILFPIMMLSGGSADCYIGPIQISDDPLIESGEVVRKKQ